MSALVYLIPISLILGAVALFTFLWTLKHGQYEDMEGAAARILTDEDKPLPQDDDPKEAS
ncbi:MAG: cbb3-type cytochrome oxidase assembly protein CcoS [Pseudomonadota bacterium]